MTLPPFPRIRNRRFPLPSQSLQKRRFLPKRWRTRPALTVAQAHSGMLAALLIATCALSKHAGGVAARADPIVIDVDTGRAATHEPRGEDMPPFERPRLHGNMILYGFYVYSTMTARYGDHRIDAPTHDHPRCQDSGWHKLENGWHIAPNTDDVRTNVVAAFTWGTHLLVLHNESRTPPSYPAYRTQGFPPAGREFGDSQSKLQTRVLDATGAVGYRLPWTCYQVLIRRRIRGRDDNDSQELENYWKFADDPPPLSSPFSRVF